MNQKEFPVQNQRFLSWSTSSFCSSSIVTSLCSHPSARALRLAHRVVLAINVHDATSSAVFHVLTCFSKDSFQQHKISNPMLRQHAHIFPRTHAVSQQFVTLVSRWAQWAHNDVCFARQLEPNMSASDEGTQSHTREETLTGHHMTTHGV